MLTVPYPAATAARIITEPEPAGGSVKVALAVFESIPLQVFPPPVIIEAPTRLDAPPAEQANPLAKLAPAMKVMIFKTTNQVKVCTIKYLELAEQLRNSKM